MSQKPQSDREAFRTAQLRKYERYLGVTDDSVTYALYLLSNNGEHRKVIDLCRELMEQRPYVRQYPAFLASSYYNLQQKDSAYYFALHYLKQQAARDTITLNDPLMFSKYPSFFPILTDTILKKKMLQVYLEHYIQKGYPETELGIQLIKLAHQDQYIRHLLSFRYARCSDSIEVSVAHASFQRNNKVNDHKFLQLYTLHPEYITVAEVGDEASGFCQGILMDHITDSTIRSTTLLPMLKRAMERQEYPVDSYVESCIYVLKRQQNMSRQGKFTIPYVAYTTVRIKLSGVSK